MSEDTARIFDGEYISNVFDEIMYGESKRPLATGLIAVCPEFLAIYNVEREYYGRDWRRIKRETRKALDKVKREREPAGIDRSAFSFWRTAEYA